MDSTVVVTSMIENGEWDRQDTKVTQRKKIEKIRNLPCSLSQAFFFLGVLAVQFFAFPMRIR